MVFRDFDLLSILNWYVTKSIAHLSGPCPFEVKVQYSFSFTFFSLLNQQSLDSFHVYICSILFYFKLSIFWTTTHSIICPLVSKHDCLDRIKPSRMMVCCCCCWWCCCRSWRWRQNSFPYWVNKGSNIRKKLVPIKTMSKYFLI